MNGGLTLILCATVLALSICCRQSHAIQADAPTEAAASEDTDAESKARNGMPRPSLLSPDAVENRIREDDELKPNFFDANIMAPYEAWKTGVYENTGLKFGGDYSAMYMGATDSLGESQTAAGMIRLFASWELVGRGTGHAGSLVGKIEHRHSYTKASPFDLASEVGYAGITTPIFSDEGLRLTNLYWRQAFADNRFVAWAGFIDPTDYLDVYAMVIPWTHFSNYVFSTGSASIGLPNAASLGIAGGGWITDNVYAIAGISDANAQPTDPFNGFDTFFSDFETFQSVEVGYARSQDEMLLHKVHAVLWHTDARQAAGVPEGYGVNVSATAWIEEKWLPFLRAGWTHNGGSILDRSVSAGLGYQSERGGDLVAIGLNWGRPNANTYGLTLGDQITTEVFYRWQITNNIQLTPSIQFLVNPALNPNDDYIGVFGLRARLSF